MEGLKYLYVLASIFISFSTADQAPAIVWGSSKNGNNRDHHSTLENFTPEKFYHHVKKVIGDEQNTLVIAFIEQNLSLEDLSWRDSENKIAFPQLESTSKSAKFTNFFTSVHSPVKALKNFEKDGFNIHHVDLKNQKLESAKISPHAKNKKTLLILELDDANTDENRPDFLKRHDGIISELYLEFVNKGYQVTAIYTGHHCSWVEPEIPVQRHRVRRLLADNTTIAVSGTLWKGNDSTILFYSKTVPYFQLNGVRVNLSEASAVWSVVNDTAQSVQVSLTSGINLFFEFPLSGGYWKMNPVTVQNGSDSYSLKTYPEIVVPLDFSYHCSQDVVFTRKDEEVSLVFESFQVQPFLSGKGFGDTYDCVWFFTSVIWSALFVSLLLGSVLVWGLGMLMGIKTMDQFDDPKGKTIQVTSTE